MLKSLLLILFSLFISTGLVLYDYGKSTSNTKTIYAGFGIMSITVAVFILATVLI